MIPATKDKSKGRASGGLITLVRRDFFSEVTLVDACNLWIFVSIKYENKAYNIGNVYWPPKVDDSYCVGSLDDFLTSLEDSEFRSAGTIVMGYFNARLGCLNSFVDEIFDETELIGLRNSMDNKVTKRGKQLTLAMESTGFILCNGRSPSDNPANYTYVSKTGCSVTDFVWLNISLIKLFCDLTVLNFSDSSDHFGVCIELDVSTQSRLVQTAVGFPVENIKWDETKIDDYLYNLSGSTLLYFNSEDTDCLFNNFKIAILDSARKTGMLTVKKSSERVNSFMAKKPWFDCKCNVAKRKVNKDYKKFKSNKQSLELLENYISARDQYKKIVAQAKTEYNGQIQVKLSNLSSSKEFWNTVKLFNTKDYRSNGVELDAWVEFYKDVYPGRCINDRIFVTVLHPYLDSEFSLDELNKVLSKCSNNKSPGPDKIVNEFLKNLPSEWSHYFLNMINRIFESENVPRSFAEVNMSMLYKKGDHTDPMNYRGIALLNSVTKVFTSLLAKRLGGWAESCRLIPEEQAGFRAKRMGNIKGGKSVRLDTIIWPDGGIVPAYVEQGGEKIGMPLYQIVTALAPPFTMVIRVK
ncbi:uncharacterized protein LOC122506384 [Leptopilina heterotoma]|uniref:uncharacterized protein LOC122506384 n=1 Tax=Leptopilina heterotoma TaxID=63436 RepID=UPI001CA7BADE|nr:uncharacterized protein LOC122506384 [Leptopilina heterotoma]